MSCVVQGEGGPVDFDSQFNFFGYCMISVDKLASVSVFCSM